MKLNSKGSILLELLVATAMAGIVLGVVMQSYKDILKVEKKSSKHLDLDWNINRALERMERDLFCAFIPMDKDGKKKPRPDKQKTPDNKAPEDKNKKEEPPIFFSLKNDEAPTKSKFFNGKFKLTKNLSFCSTSTMNRPKSKKITRISYILEESQNPKINTASTLYTLYRIESDNLAKLPKKNDLDIEKILVLENLTELFIKCKIKEQPNDKKEKAQLKWLDETETEDNLPILVSIQGAIAVNEIKTEHFELFVGLPTSNQPEEPEEKPKEDAKNPGQTTKNKPASKKQIQSSAKKNNNPTAQKTASGGK